VRAAEAKPVTPKEAQTPTRPKPRKIASAVGTAGKPETASIPETAPIKVKPARAKTGLAKTLASLTPKPAKRAGGALCGKQLTAGIPTRSLGAPSGSKFIKTAMDLSGPVRDRAVEKQIFAGNIPRFLSDLTPVSLSGLDARGAPVKITICVAPDYLAVGNNRDYVRVPMGLPAAVEVTKKLGFLLPTTKMVDAIYRQAALHLRPSPMQAGPQMSSTAYLWKHNQTVEAQRTAGRAGRDALVAGQKKDLVMSNALLRAPGRVAIYGWHRMNGKPIQPLSTVHGQSYADYSHGIRLVSKTAYVNGKPRPLAGLLADPTIASVLSKEGPLKRPLRLVASLASR